MSLRGGEGREADEALDLVYCPSELEVAESLSSRTFSVPRLTSLTMR